MGIGLGLGIGIGIGLGLGLVRGLGLGSHLTIIPWLVVMVLKSMIVSGHGTLEHVELDLLGNYCMMHWAM